MTYRKHNSAVSQYYRAGFFLLICVFVIASVPRLSSLEAHWSSDEALWLTRSADFMSSVKKGEFSKTLIAYHPGVTTMWVAGLRTFFTSPDLDVRNLARSRFLIGIVVWIGISATCLLLSRLFGRWISLISFACLAFSPLFLAQTRRVHTDALATTFILLTVLLFLLYCQNRRSLRYLIFSSIAFGLALLSKSDSVLLLPCILLCLFIFRNPHSRLKQNVIAFLCFFSCSLLTILVLWPVFWTPTFAILGFCLLGGIYILSETLKKETISLKSLSFFAASVVLSVVCIQIPQTIWMVFDTAGKAVITPHEVKHFFLGKAIYDPGWLFYPFVLTIRSTPLMLPLAILGCIQLWKHRNDSEDTVRHFKTGLTLVICVLLFTICLSATSKKFSRYLLPAFPILEILAAIGFVEVLKWSYTVLRSRFSHETISLKHTFTAVACLLFFLIQVMPVLALHPYYGTYYNTCWKVTDITKVITIGEASGLDLAAQYLKKKEMERPMRVQVSPLSAQFFIRYFIGWIRTPDMIEGPLPDYEVVYIRDSQIGLVPQTGTLNGELEALITLNGIDHVWIYRIPKKETP